MRLPNVPTQANEFKDLGVIIDDSLKFTSHLNHAVAKASVQACLMRKCFVSKDVPTLSRAFKTYLRPILEYAFCVWSPTYTTVIELIKSVQRKFTKRLYEVYSSHPADNCNNSIKNTNSGKTKRRKKNYKESTTLTPTHSAKTVQTPIPCYLHLD